MSFVTMAQLGLYQLFPILALPADCYALRSKLLPQTCIEVLTIRGYSKAGVSFSFKLLFNSMLALKKGFLMMSFR
jgi:hypothetical protein